MGQAAHSSETEQEPEPDANPWHDAWQRARSLCEAGDAATAARACLAAYNLRPQRAEPLYDLAKYCRMRGEYALTLLFAEAGLRISEPFDGDPAIEAFPYEIGFLEEISTAGKHLPDPRSREKGWRCSEWLSLARHSWDQSRELAVHNGAWYTLAAPTLFPSTRLTQITCAAPEHYYPTNPSIVSFDGKLIACVRCINYTIEDHGITTGGHGAFDTINFIVSFDADLNTTSCRTLRDGRGVPKSIYEHVIGWEDIRLIVLRDQLLAVGATRQYDPEGNFKTVLARIDLANERTAHLEDVSILPSYQRHEKNWMPFVSNDALRLIHSLDPVKVLDQFGCPVATIGTPIVATHLRGGSQLIPLDGGWLCLIHETVPVGVTRRYSQRFLWFDDKLNLRRTTRRFFFMDDRIEFASGLAWHPDTKSLVASFGVYDAAAWLAVIEVQDIRQQLNDISELTAPFRTI